jgi:hypothetical protein
MMALNRPLHEVLGALDRLPLTDPVIDPVQGLTQDLVTVCAQEGRSHSLNFLQKTAHGWTRW